MEEQPVAFATSSRSPNSCVSSRRYGVSPQPAHAPEYSNSGVRYWIPRTSDVSRPAGRLSGSVAKNARLPRSRSRMRRLRLHVDGADAGGFEAPGRADLDAQLAARAVFDRHLQREPQVREAAPGERRRGKPGRRRGQRRLVVVTRADDGVRTDHRAVAALDADLRLPRRHQVRDVPLLPLRRARRIRAVGRHRADRQLVAAPGHHHGGDLLDELRAPAAARPAAAGGCWSAPQAASPREDDSSVRSTAAKFCSTSSRPFFP